MSETNLDNVTEHQRAAEQLRAVQAWQTAVLESALDCIIGMDHQGRIIEFNRAAEKTFGYQRGDVLHRPLSDLLIPPALRDCHELGLAQYLATGEGSLVGNRIETTARRADGTEFFVELAVTRAPVEGPPAFIGYLRDISARRQAEDERAQYLRERTQLVEHLGLLLESTSEGIYGIDSEGRCTFINKAAADMLGLTAGEAVGQNMHALIHHSRADGSPYPVEQCPIFQARRAGKRCRIDGEVLWRRDGVSFPVEYASCPILENGVVAGAVVSFTDVSERKRLEEHFRQAQKMEAVGRLAGGVAHDFNNILTIIMGFCDLLLARARPGDPTREFVEQIKKAGDRATSLTRQLLAFSRMQLVTPRVLDLNVVTTEMEKMLRRLIGADVEMALLRGPQLGAVKADPGQVEQILLNLAVNARDAMPDGGKLTIETANVDLSEDYATAHRGARPGAYVMLAVTDTGSGMDGQTRARIFEPFFTTKPQGKGTGLGLATVYGIVKQNEGYIEVASAPGRGTTFKIFWPRVEQAADPARRLPGSGPPSPGSETILLVEDDDAVRALVRSVLDQSGYRVLQVQRGDEALEVSARHVGPIHLLLTDMIMPKMNGRQLAERLAVRRPETRVLYMSGYTDDTVVRLGLETAQLAFLPKPFTPELVTRKVREVLDASPTTQASRTASAVG